MGIFAERTHYRVSDVNKKANSLLAFETKESSWCFIVTREYQDYSHIPIEQHIRVDEHRSTIRRPPERIWENIQHPPYWGCYLVPWNTYHEEDSSLGMIAYVEGKPVGKTMKRLCGMNWCRLQTFLSEMQYSFLSEFRQVRNPYLILHQRRWKRNEMNRLIVEYALSPQRLESFLQRGYSIDEWCV